MIKRILVTLVLTLTALGTARSAEEVPYGPPELQPPAFLRPYSQRSFRWYYAHRFVEHFRRPSVEMIPTFEIDVQSTYSVQKFPCPYAYPSAFYPRPELQR